MAKKRIDYNLAKKAAGNAALTEQITTSTTGSKDSIKDILISELIVNPYQPRIEMDVTQLKELALSIEREGLLQPILVTPDLGNGYIILAGHRRVEAHKLLNKEYVKAVIHSKVAHERLAIIPIIENLQRDDMDPIENAIAFKRLLDEKIFSSQKELADKISVSKQWMSKILTILKLPTNLLEKIRADKYKDINVLNALNNLDDKDSMSAYETIKDMTRSDAIQYIKSMRQMKEVKPEKSNVFVTKDKITINIKDITTDKHDKINKLVLEIEALLE